VFIINLPDELEEFDGIAQSVNLYYKWKIGLECVSVCATIGEADVVFFPPTWSDYAACINTYRKMVSRNRLMAFSLDELRGIINDFR
jgi:hypothetical protein